MSSIQSYNAILTRFKAFAEGHFILKAFSHGFITNEDLLQFPVYPFMHVIPSIVQYGEGSKEFQFEIVFADLPRDKETKTEYQAETLSDLQQIAEDLINTIENDDTFFGSLISVTNASITPFMEADKHTLTGWKLTMTLIVPYYWDACNVPADWNNFGYSSQSGTYFRLHFINSLTLANNGDVSLVNDEENPEPNYYYGTNAEGVRGWHLLESGLTCEDLPECQTIIDMNTEIGLKANSEDLGATAFSNDYNDLDNLPTIPPAQVNSDWNATSGVAEILNKPTIPAPVTSVSILKHEVKLNGAMTKGTAVYVSSADGTNMVVSKASASSEATSSKTMGLLMSDGANNAKVDVITEGLLAGLNTSTANAGDPVWLSATAGQLIFGLANKPVAPLHLVFIGIVTRANLNNGEIFVRVQNGFELNEIHDVLIQSVANNEGLFYESSTSLWKNKSIQQIISSLNGILIPQMTTTQRNAISSPTTGLQIFNTTEGYHEYYDAFWGWMPLANQNEWKRKWGTEYFNDFGANNAFTGDGVFQTFPVNGGSYMSFNPTPNGSNYIGIMGLATGIQTAGQNSIRGDLNTGRFLYPAFRMSLISRLWVQNLSDATNRYHVVFGLSNGANSTIGNGCVFIYDQGGIGTGTTASPNWQIITATSSIRTNFVTSVVVVPETWYSFRIESNASFTELYYYINDILVRTETTNIPTGIANVPCISITKTAGTTNRALAVDYLGLKAKLNSAR